MVWQDCWPCIELEEGLEWLGRLGWKTGLCGYSDIDQDLEKSEGWCDHRYSQGLGDRKPKNQYDFDRELEVADENGCDRGRDGLDVDAGSKNRPVR
jgi:hypothetical protein